MKQKGKRLRHFLFVVIFLSNVVILNDIYQPFRHFLEYTCPVCQKSKHGVGHESRRS